MFTTNSEVVDVALISDTCFPGKRLNEFVHSKIHSEIDEDPLCRDHVHEFVESFRNIVPNIHIKIFRVYPEGGLTYTSRICKTNIGISKVYEEFPSKRYYFKMDLDTLLFSKRFLNFINTVESVTNPSTPLFIGQATEHMFGGNNLVYANGGNGYGFNNIAMAKMAVRINCKYRGKHEDGVSACRYYNLFPGGKGHLLAGGDCFGVRTFQALTFHGTIEQWHDKVIDSVHKAFKEEW